MIARTSIFRRGDWLRRQCFVAGDRVPVEVILCFNVSTMRASMVFCSKKIIQGRLGIYLVFFFLHTKKKKKMLYQNFTKTFAKYWFLGAATSTAVRMYYNGVYATVSNMFKMSALGLGWGDTPVEAQVLCIIGNVTFALYDVWNTTIPTVSTPYFPSPPSTDHEEYNSPPSKISSRLAGG